MFSVWNSPIAWKSTSWAPYTNRAASDSRKALVGDIYFQAMAAVHSQLGDWISQSALRWAQ